MLIRAKDLFIAAMDGKGSPGACGPDVPKVSQCGLLCSQAEEAQGAIPYERVIS